MLPTAAATDEKAVDGKEEQQQGVCDSPSLKRLINLFPLTILFPSGWNPKLSIIIINNLLALNDSCYICMNAQETTSKPVIFKLNIPTLGHLQAEWPITALANRF